MLALRQVRKGFALASRDFKLWFLLNVIPDKLFPLILMSTKSLKKYYKSEYTQPSIVEIDTTLETDLSYKASALNGRIEEALFSEKLAEPSTSSLIGRANETHPLLRVAPERVFIVVPNGWLNGKSEEWHTQGGFIRFLARGFQENLIPYQLVEIDSIDLEPVIASQVEQFVIFFSLSKARSKVSSLEKLRKLRENYPLSPTWVVGVNTMSPSNKNLDLSMEWQGVLDLIIYFEETSDFVDQLSKVFSVYHMPPLRFEEAIGINNEVREFDLAISSLVKHNRAAWLITLKYLSVRFQMNVRIRLVSDALKKRLPKLFGYLPYLEVSRIWNAGKAGLVLAHRDPGKDVHHLGTFWDFYLNGCIPIVQYEKAQPNFCSYLKKELDYFVINETKDLAEIMIFLKNYPETVSKLRARIENRIGIEFTPKMMVFKLLCHYSSSMEINTKNIYRKH